jgi:hypothetical protein
MKQLLLYFLFFIGSALILIQCAKLFPTIYKIPHRHSKTIANGNNYKPNRAISGWLNPANDFSLKKIFVSYNPYLPYKMILKIKSIRMFYTHDLSVKHYKFASNGYEKSLQNKQQ